MSEVLTVQLALREIEPYAQALTELIGSLTQDQLWSKAGGIPNSIGTLARHLTGNLNHYLGAGILKNGYIRHRDREFSDTDLPKAQVVSELQGAVEVARRAAETIDGETISQPHTTPCGEECESLAFHIVETATHFAFHCGQADYAGNYIS